MKELLKVQLINHIKVNIQIMKILHIISSLRKEDGGLPESVKNLSNELNITKYIQILLQLIIK